MPLSEHEQQLLDQLEKQLRSEDPRFAKNISQPGESKVGNISARRLVGGILVLILGIALIVCGLIFAPSPFNVVAGIVGFIVMTGGGYWAISGDSSEQAPEAGTTTGTGTAKPAKGSSSFMDKLEGRWDKRRHQD